MTKREKISVSLQKYIPEEFVPYVVELLFSSKVSFRISKPRKSVRGTYRGPKDEKGLHRISVNGDLNPYAFLITTLHEFAHLNTYVKHKNTVKAHGREWKDEFKRLLIPVLEMNTLPKDIETALMMSLNNLKASSCTDPNLIRALNNYDKDDNQQPLLEEIGNNAYFRIGKKVFQRGILRRTRYLCKEVNTGKQYLVSRLAKVEVINIENK